MSGSMIRFLCANLVTVVGAISMVPSAGAQASPAQLSRHEVKEQTRSAALAHLLIPAGEGAWPPPGQTYTPGKARRNVKEETLQAAKDHALLPAGEAAGSPELGTRAVASGTSRTRAEVMAETRAAVRAHELHPAGEGWYPIERR